MLFLGCDRQKSQRLKKNPRVERKFERPVLETLSIGGTFIQRQWEKWHTYKETTALSLASRKSGR